MSLFSYLYDIGAFLFKYKTGIFVTSVFLIVATYVYIKFVKPKLNKKFVENRDFVHKEHEPKVATLYYFYTTWCPLSKQANPEWKALQEETNGIVKDINIVFKEIDCDLNSDVADQFKITGYPTIKLIYNNTTYEYDAKPNKDTLIKFLNSVL